MNRILVTGGGGYIGSFMTQRLLQDGNEVVVVDNLERGHASAIDKRVHFIQGDLRDKSFVNNLFLKEKFSGVVHFAGYISMAESVHEPQLYFENNVFAALNVIEAMHKTNQDKFIFSSTAGVYGNPNAIPIKEDHAKNPTNPYGESKLMVEKILEWYYSLFGFRYAALRYFNAAGAALDGSIGEDHNPETHIIANAMKAAIDETEFTLYGNDYDTPDGTCVRDYIHVLDLVEAHVLVLNKLDTIKQSYVFNVGTGKGYSNKEVIDMIKKETGKNLSIKTAPRRSGDANELVADPTKIKQELGFSPRVSDLQTIVSSAWKWHSRSK